MARLWSSIDINVCRFNLLQPFVLFSLVLLLAFSPAAGQADDYRAWTGEFMRMGAGARAMGMGNAYTAVESDIYSSYFNPAGLASMNERELAFSFRYLSMDRKFRYFVLGIPVEPDAGFALSWINAGTDDIIGRDLNGNPTDPLRDNRNAFTISFAKYINKYVSVGLNTKLAFWKLADDDAKSFGFDLGVLVRPYRSLSASFVIRDVRSRFTWKSEYWDDYISDADGQPMEKEDKFPVYYTGGIAYRAFNDKLVLSYTLEHVESNPPGHDFGVSYEYKKILTLRTGLYNYTSSDELDSGSFTAGFTLQVTGSISLDYAYATDSIGEGAMHVVTFHARYGE